MDDEGALERILIVEDDPLVLLALQEAFEGEGFAVRTAETAGAAIAALAEPQAVFAALVTDLQLGGGADGWAVAAAARRRIPDLPVVFATGEKIDAAGLGARDRYAPKPYSAEQVVRAVRDLLRQSVGARPAAPCWDTPNAH